jgi:hypothetical protein
VEGFLPALLQDLSVPAQGEGVALLDALLDHGERTAFILVRGCWLSLPAYVVAKIL